MVAVGLPSRVLCTLPVDCATTGGAVTAAAWVAAGGGGGADGAKHTAGGTRNAAIKGASRIDVLHALTSRSRAAAAARSMLRCFGHRSVSSPELPRGESMRVAPLANLLKTLFDDSSVSCFFYSPMFSRSACRTPFLRTELN